MFNLIPQKDFKAVIFDLDGTLIDSIPTWHRIDIEYLKLSNLPLNQDILEEAKNMSFMDWATKLVAHYNLTKTPTEVMSEIEQMALFAYENTIPLKDGVLEYLDYLQQNGIKMAIATAGIKPLASAICRRYGIDKYMENFTYIAEVERGKEHPDIYLLASENLKMRVEDCLVFEDLLFACEGAMKGGFRAIPVYDAFSLEHHSTMEKLTGFSMVRDFKSLIKG